MPEVSVVIPAFNEEKYIRDCLVSVRQQNFRDFELIVVDDGSTDRTYEIAKLYADLVVRQPNRGVAAARQVGFELSRGKIIISSDADSFFEPDWIEKFLEEFISEEIVGVCGHIIFYDGANLDRWLTSDPLRFVMRANFFFGNYTFFGCNFAVRREAFFKAGGFNLKCNQYEDMELAKRLKRIGTVKYAPHIVAYTSSRRFKADRIGFLMSATRSFFKVAWSRDPSLPPFKPVR